MKVRYFVITIVAIMVLAGCNALQTAASDPNSGLNSAVDTGQKVIAAAPVAAALLPAYGQIILGIGAIASAAGNAYQAYRKSLLEQTTRAIVRGVEQSPTETQETVKPLIQSEMESAAILAQGKAIVAGLKNG